MQTLLFATNNQHKVEEIQKVLPAPYLVMSLLEADITIEIEEPYDTLEENAHKKAHTIFEMTRKNCFSEDTGLEVDSLEGAPGVKSARYAGIERDYKKNNEKLLQELANKNDRTARFRTVICLIMDNHVHYFEGICEGTIALAPKGIQGFGYDPIFIPKGSNHSFAEMNIAEKNKFSHRKKAIDKMVAFLESLQHEKS
ncbi:MAG: RdgB/HAM1 family non-canonical purine NTP pyrophosphatase [Hydrotalea flava]|uniref:RdgB/HAM1 family non-canonical purine NTP pyrophosphatase n=1 Tax=Hydrotalea TaxID=1004300 RepID=UPI00094666A4|nr:MULTISPECIES: RdgB/HAM1 family non-canonical purine NTP pyrophosphatase [Hydrotalea]MBY0349090.1 RdgB/HAM1 family non-canonical purine NTP pyrophosphatase [Hydrotalea flava]RWZ88861.1 MAG: RdgB/HAM1 family non-canonical purine NTP pyrophosphatase [Hydrotalea sp. AMD]